MSGSAHVRENVRIDGRRNGRINAKKNIPARDQTVWGSGGITYDNVEDDDVEEDKDEDEDDFFADDDVEDDEV